ncbi:MAG: hypothetical protein FWE22_01235 [Firmicutes bacterium]|nr:hypothetical protein [Bacillota bacterium]
MNKRRGILEFLNMCNNNPNYNKKISNDERLSKLVEKLCEFFHEHYILKDIEEERETSHQLKYEMLYFEEENPNFEQIALAAGVASIYALKHHVRKYNESAFNYIKKKSEMNSIYKSLLTEYLRHEFSIRE